MPDAWIRGPQVTSRFARVFAVCAVFFVVLALGAILGHPRGRDAHSVLLLAGAINLVLAIAAAGIARQYAKRGLLISTNRVLVRNILSTREIALEDADLFSPGIPFGLAGPCPMLKRDHGAAIGVGGLARAAVRWRNADYLRELEPLCEELNKLLADMKKEHAASSGTWELTLPP